MKKQRKKSANITTKNNKAFMDVKSLYIHIPFCNHLCSYCDFPKLQYFTIFAKPYLNKLKEELDSYNIKLPLDTIYVGGGTPTSLEDDLFLELLKIIKPFSKGVKEYTFEANPESLSPNKIKMMKKYGVNRVSLGVQSTDESILKSINRHHNYEDVKESINNLKIEGIDNINVDLILSLPNSSIEQIKIDLDRLLPLGIKHISCYSLLVNPNTIFYINGVKEADDDEARQYYDFVHNYLLEKGFIHYEVSNFAKEGYQSKHNFTYWNNNRYFGVGLGAAGYIDNIRYTNTKSINEYLKGHFLYEKEIVTLKEEKEYQIMLNLRTNKGIDLSYFKNRFNVDLLKEKNEIINKLIKNGKLYIKDNHLIPTYEGMMILDQIILDLY